MKTWKVAIVRDTAKPMLGLHGLHAAFLGLPGVEIAALVDANTDRLPEKLHQMQARRHYLSCQAMFNEMAPDILVVTSRHPGDHLPQIRLAAEHRCHVYCEKPLARTLEEAREIDRLARVGGIKVAMAHPARHAIAFLTMQKMIREGVIGRPVTIHGRGKSDDRGGGEDLIVLGTHILDMMATLFGSPEYVWADVTTDGKPIDALTQAKTVEPIGPCAGDSILAVFGFAGGVRGIFESHKGVFERGKSRQYMGVTVTGTKGSLSFRFEDARNAVQSLRYYPSPIAPEAGQPAQEVELKDGRVIPDAQPLDDSRCAELQVPNPMFLSSNRYAAWDLIQAISENRSPAVGLEDAIRVQEMIQGIFTSAVKGQSVRFPLISECHPLGG